MTIGSRKFRVGVSLLAVATARDEAESAARSGALALAMWQTDRSTSSLVSVQLEDARDDVVDAYESAAALSVTDPATGDVQRTLTVSITMWSTC
jgi:hypothetical protein